ncbi:9742_t:CDS:2 [Funneliformis caledonium]|uniref:GDP-fucose protein O-fucosyltransferase 2 n=1 Tax=Funneliformis caledonium TaxID=1117310 RepID=A0A9N9AGV1_9GLOM|nr:9742_t:CDS:2 [Funneliformis caledonium]
MAIRIKNTRLCSSFFVMFLLLNVILYLYYDNDMSEKLTEFTEQCDETKYSPSNEHEEAINRKFCGKSECKFLFTYLQPEQETKANMHFRSFVKLAKALNRTMVLTNVGNSRINACQKFTFGFYYNVKALQKMFPDVKFITQKDFQCWSKKRRIKPNTEHVKILPGGKIQSMKLVTPYPDLLKTKSCLNRFGFKMDDQTVFKQFYTGQKSLESIKKQTKFSEFLINNLKTDVEILLTTHLVYYPLFSNISKPIPYSNHNFEEASKIINRIKPYVAIHWRMERAILDKLPECAEALVKKLQKIKESQGIQNVYLATDYPITGGTTQSQTFHLLTEKHHKAINLLNSTFNIHTWSSSKIFANLRNDEMIEKEFSGAGIPGIVDKLVCMDADYFLATPEGCGRAQSTYTTMIVNEREKSIELGVKPQLKNIVERW